MPRGPRILLKNACYHIINRGNQQQQIFFEDADFACYLKLLKHYKRKFRFRLFGYCLMPNHIHMLLQMEEPKELSQLLKCLTQSYTTWFNRKYKKIGHLWQGRFKSMVVHKDEYFLDCLHYIEVNPARKGLVSAPLDYLWSSYKDRVLNKENGLLDLPNST